MRVMTVPANMHCRWNQGTTHRGRCGAQTGAVDDGQRGRVAGNDGGLEPGTAILGASPLISIRRKDGVIACHLVRELGGILCANGRDGRVLDARNTSGGVYPGGGVEE